MKILLALEMSDEEYQALSAWLSAGRQLQPNPAEDRKAQLPDQEDPDPLRRRAAAARPLAKRAAKAAVEEIPFDEILELLNRECGRDFRRTEYTESFIRARWKEGKRVPDFKAAVVNMKPLWEADAKTRVWLRPETLWGRKMDSYMAAGKPVRSTLKSEPRSCPICATPWNDSSSSCLRCSLEKSSAKDPGKVEAHRQWWSEIAAQRKAQ
jgi:uncharacterized phage protein (TIGR02220 family)